MFSTGRPHSDRGRYSGVVEVIEDDLVPKGIVSVPVLGGWYRSAHLDLVQVSLGR